MPSASPFEWATVLKQLNELLADSEWKGSSAADLPHAINGRIKSVEIGRIEACADYSQTFMEGSYTQL